MNPQLVLLETLDGLDRELKRVEGERQRLDTRIADLREGEARARAALDAARAALEGNRAEERTASRRLEELRASRTSALRVLETGAGNAEAAQRQLERCDGLIDQAETELLELLEAQDQRTKEVAAAEAALTAATGARVAEEGAQPAQRAVLDQQHAAAAGQRGGVHSQLDRELRDRYDDFRARGRWAVAKVRGNACEACSRAVQPQMVADVRTNHRLVTCHGCHRWLVVPEDR